MGNSLVVIFLLLAFCMLFTIGQKNEGNDKCKLRVDYRKDVCFDDRSGYSDWECNHDKSSEDYGNWVTTRVVKCKQGLKCHCERDDRYKQCGCYNSRRFPSFPRTGVVRWTGTKSHEENNRKTTVSIRGEIHKDNHGYLHKWTDVGEWGYQTKKLPETIEKFHIIIPTGNIWEYAHYRGDKRSKSCQKSIIKGYYRSGRLDKFFPLKDRNYLTYQNSKEVDSLTRETWNSVYSYKDYKNENTWKIDYDENAIVAYPVRYVHRLKEGGKLRITSLDYKYEPIKGKNTTFKLEDYCNEN